jgi:uncharacterized protein (TIGR03435 family)
MTQNKSNIIPFRKITHLGAAKVSAIAPISCGLALFFVAAGILAPLGAYAQSQAAATPRLEFEVAAIKPSEDIQAVIAAKRMPNVGMKVDNSEVTIGYATPLQLISQAYKLDPLQVSGPDWMKTEHFDIEAKLPEGTTKDQVPEMLQSLLADRFKMVVHRETRDLPAYVLEVGKNGVKFQPSPADPTDPAPLTDKDGVAMDGPNGQMRVKTTGNPASGGVTQMTGTPGGTVKVSVTDGVMRMESSKMSMDLFRQQLTRFLNEPVIDKTGLTGTYVVAVDLSIADLTAVARANGFNVPAGGPGGGGSASSGPAPTDSDPAGSSIFSSIEKLGLKLQKEKAPMEVIIVDHMEKSPTDN